MISELENNQIAIYSYPMQLCLKKGKKIKEKKGKSAYLGDGLVFYPILESLVP